MRTDAICHPGGFSRKLFFVRQALPDDCLRCSSVHLASENLEEAVEEIEQSS